MKFVGSTIIYSYLQAIGVIYSHEEECFLNFSDVHKIQRIILIDFQLKNIENYRNIMLNY